MNMRKLKGLIAEYKLNCFYNVDETKIMICMMPRHNYVLVGELKTAWGVKGMKEKDRITLIIAGNASGRDKVPVRIIGHAENPRCFHVRKCPVH